MEGESLLSWSTGHDQSRSWCFVVVAGNRAEKGGRWMSSTWAVKVAVYCQRQGRCVVSFESPIIEPDLPKKHHLVLVFIKRYKYMEQTMHHFLGNPGLNLVVQSWKVEVERSTKDSERCGEIV
jgi:hypothetical protein